MGKKAAKEGDAIMKAPCFTEVKKLGETVFIGQKKLACIGSYSEESGKTLVITRIGKPSVFINGIPAAHEDDQVTWVCPDTPPPSPTSGEGKIQTSPDATVFIGD